MLQYLNLSSLTNHILLKRLRIFLLQLLVYWWNYSHLILKVEDQQLLLFRVRQVSLVNTLTVSFSLYIYLYFCSCVCLNLHWDLIFSHKFWNVQVFRSTKSYMLFCVVLGTQIMLSFQSHVSFLHVYDLFPS